MGGAGERSEAGGSIERLQMDGSSPRPLVCLQLLLSPALEGLLAVSGGSCRQLSPWFYDSFRFQGPSSPKLVAASCSG